MHLMDEEYLYCAMYYRYTILLVSMIIFLSYLFFMTFVRHNYQYSIKHNDFLIGWIFRQHYKNVNVRNLYNLNVVIDNINT